MLGSSMSKPSKLVQKDGAGHWYSRHIVGVPNERALLEGHIDVNLRGKTDTFCTMLNP